MMKLYLRIDKSGMTPLLYSCMEFNDSEYLCIVSSILGKVILDVYYFCVFLSFMMQVRYY
jgi:hypothetical protein